MKLTKKQTAVIHSLVTTLLQNGLIEIVFEKSNGSIRVVNATREVKLLAEHNIVLNANDVLPSTTFEAIRFVDNALGDWRSARLDTIISINGMKMEQFVNLVK